jgi:hypothetical protein
MSLQRLILITGPGGFVERHLLRALRAGFSDAALLAVARAMDGPPDGADETLLSNSAQYFPPNSAQNFPVYAVGFGCFRLCLNRKESSPVSRMSQ